MTKVVILAGGLGTRFTEETEVRPKPMIEIGGRPILWHIMKSYAHFGFNDFYVALGHKGEVIKRYFLDYLQLNGSLTLDLASGRIEERDRQVENWVLHLCDTGIAVNTGGRLKRLESELRGATFMATYGDGVANVDLQALLRFHKAHGKLATVTAVRPPSRFGGLTFDGDAVAEFVEKPQIGEGWINGGFLVLEPAALDFLAGDDSSLERDMLEPLAAERQLMAYRHEDFWQCMDTLRDKRVLDALWAGERAPWKLWEGSYHL